jgi:hypothetical protein
MISSKTLLAVSTLALLGACTSPGQHRAQMAQHHAQMGPPHCAQMQPHLQAMQEQMRSARTPEERQAIMNQHMQAMHPGGQMHQGMPMSQDMAQMCLQHMQQMQGQPGGPPMPGMQHTPASPTAPTR